ncbi:MAG: hypothetical protein HYR85_19955 [Planctomycetes bacterium]|nr:hypothetical protein [Planctomycetota bacterium]
MKSLNQLLLLPLLCACATWIAGCSGGGGGGGSSAPIDVAGPWDGAFSAPQGAGALHASFQQAGAHLTGTVSADDTVNQLVFVFALDGTIRGNQLGFDLTESQPCASGSFHGTAEISATADHMTFTFSGADCYGQRTVGGNATKQPSSDLIAENLSVSPADVFAGSSVVVSFAVRNVGPGMAAASIARVRLNTNPNSVNSNDPQLGADVPVPSLQSGVAFPFSQGVTIPAGSPIGSDFVWVSVDATATAGQGNNSRNDSASVPLTVEAVIPPLEIMTFSQADRTDVARNETLTLITTTAIDPQSVSIDGLQVRTGLDVVPGRLVITDNMISFIPTVRPGDRNDYSPPNNPPINGIGLRASTRYDVVAIANSPFSMKSRNGTPLASTFSANFMTNNTFLSESPPIPPQVVGLPVIAPGPVQPGNFFGDPNTPSTLPLFDPSNLQISVSFSEAMHPGRFNPFTTFTVVNITPANPTPGCDVSGLGQPIVGNIAGSPDAQTYSFIPLFTLGDRPCTTEPFVFRVTLTTGLTDLAGNALAQPLVFYFATADKPTEPHFVTITEDFSTQANRGDPSDPIHPNTALWNGNGFLEGSPITRRTVTVTDAESLFDLPQPLTTAGNRLQMLYFRDNFNNGGSEPGAESFISMSWGPKSNFVFASIYPLVTLKLGHSLADNSSGLQTTFDANYQGFTNNPTTVYSGPYEVRNQLTSQWQPWPQFAQDFEYSGASAVVWEASGAGADGPNTSTYQLFRNTSTAPSPSRRIYDVYNATTATCPPSTGCAENTIYHQQFVLATKKSFGVSSYYDSGISNPDYGGSLVIFDANRGGPCVGISHTGCFSVTWEGADATPAGTPDLATATGFSSDINIADGRRFIRFEIEINGDPFTGIVPIIDSVSFDFSSGG